MDTVLPADCYCVVSKTFITNKDTELLISFYEPIVGHLAVSLYLLLINDLQQRSISKDYTHHHLMATLKYPLNKIKEARTSLEAVGLVRTYIRTGDINNYIYEIYSPLLPNEFFNHPILSVVLYNNIGPQEYNELRHKYQKIKIDTKEYRDITKSMDEVYKVSKELPYIEVVERNTSDITISDKVDFDLIAASIPKGILNEKAFNKKTKELINALSFIYDIDTLKMVELIRLVLNSYGMIDKELLRNEARRMYQNQNNAMPSLIYRSQPDYLKSPDGNNTMRGRIIKMFETLSPVDFLYAKYHGVKPTNRDIKIVENLVIDLEMPPAVVNVLLDYSLKKNNNKLSVNYIETIAGQWKRANLKTAQEAMEFAEKENKRLTKKVPVKSQDKEPIWFNKENKIKDLSTEEKQELEDLLKEFK